MDETTGKLNVQELIAASREEAKARLEEAHGEDIAEVLREVPEERAAEIFQEISEEQRVDVVGRLSRDLQATLLQELGDQRTAELITRMPPDDRADMLPELPLEFQHRVFDQLRNVDPNIASEVQQLARYGEETAGGLMTTAYIAISPHLTVAEAIDEVRRQGRGRKMETIYYIYVVAFGGKLVGVVSLRDLILGDLGALIRDVMTENVMFVQVSADQEEVAQTIARYDLSAVPVLSEHGRMLGVVTVDDVVDVVIEEATEDAQRVGAVAPLEEPYLETRLVTFIKNRGIWLVVLFLGELLTASVMEHYQAQLAIMVELIVFIPLIISTGGNSGSQSSSLVIRALAVGEIHPEQWAKVLGREILVGVALGVLVGLVGFVRVFIGSDVRAAAWLAITVASSITVVVVMGTLLGSLLPLGIKRVGLDPAVSSTPLIASLLDVLGLVVYFSIGRAILSAALS